MSAPLELRPRTGVELLDVAVAFVRQHFAVLAGLAALGNIPALVINILWPPSASKPLAVWREHPGVGITRVLIGVVAYVLVQLMVATVVDALVHGRPVMLGAELRRALRRLGAGAVAYLVKILVIVLWFMLFFFPAIWAFARYWAVFPALAIEGLGPFAAIGRSKELARGNNLRVIGVAGLPILIGMIVIVVTQQLALGMGIGVRWASIVSALLGVVISPFMSVPGLLLYFDIRTRREGLDLDVATLAPSGAAA